MVILVERGTGRNGDGVVVEWISACVMFSFSVFFVVVCTILSLWAPEHSCYLGLDLGDEINEKK